MKRKLQLNLAWAAFLAALSIPAWTADIPGIVLEPGMPSSAGIESDEGFSCLAVIYPYSTWQPNVNSSDTQPTPSPVPPYVEGAIDFSITNVGANPVRAPWTLGIYNPVYTQVLQVWNFDFLNATQGQVFGNASASYETLEPDSGNTVYLGLLVQAALNTIRPSNITVNGQQCTTQLVNNVTELIAFPRNRSSAGIESGEQPVSISNGKMIGVDGNEVTMKAVNYFGFNNGATMFDGLYASGGALTQDFATVLYRIQLLGFNCIRVPFSFQNLFNSQPNSFTKSCTPASQTDIRNNLTPPNTNVPASRQLPPQVLTQGNDPGTCNQNLPNNSVYHRFLYIIQFLVRNNFYVLIDDHSEDPTVQNNPTLWVQYYAQLMADITADPPSRNRVMVDILNEPDHAGYTWDQMGPLYLAVMDAVTALPNASQTLFFIEGTGQNGFPGTNWGDGFVTNRQFIQQYRLSDPNPFFQTLLTKPYLNQVGISPHVYPPSVTFATQGFQGTSLYFRMYNSFGYLNNVGYGGHLFPIFVGEVGSRFATQTDIRSMNDIAAWLRADPNTGDAHNAVPHVAYWDWNANSGDTGGLVDDNWIDILWVKVQWLIDTINLQPWYLQSSPTTPTATPPPPVGSRSPPPVRRPPPPTGATRSPPPPVRSPPPPIRSPPAAAATRVSPPPPFASGSNTTTSNANRRPPPPVATPTPAPTPAATPAPTPSPTPAATPAPTPSPTPTPAATPAPSPTPAATPAPTPSPTPAATPAPTLSPTPTATPAPTPSPTPLPTPTTPAPTQTPAPPSPTPTPATPAPTPPSGPSPGGSPCEVYSMQSTPWPSGTGVTASSVNLFLKNTGNSTVTVPYSLTVEASGYTNTQYAWNWAVSSTASGRQSGTVNVADWETLQPNGQNIVNVGSVVESSSSQVSSFQPTRILINGVLCQIVDPPQLQS